MNTAIKKRIRKTKDANVRDRLRLVGEVLETGNITQAAKKLGMSQPWGSKWWARYKAEGFDGLEDRPRSGRPPKVAREKIDGVVTQSPTWTSDGLLDHIEEKTGVRYCPGYGGILLRKRGYSLKVAVKRHVSRAPTKDIESFQKNIRRRIKRCQKKGIPVLVQDESISLIFQMLGVVDRAARAVQPPFRWWTASKYATLLQMGRSVDHTIKPACPRTGPEPWPALPRTGR